MWVQGRVSPPGRPAVLERDGALEHAHQLFADQGAERLNGSVHRRRAASRAAVPSVTPAGPSGEPIPKHASTVASTCLAQRDQSHRRIGTEPRRLKVPTGGALLVSPSALSSRAAGSFPWRRGLLLSALPVTRGALDGAGGPRLHGRSGRRRRQRFDQLHRGIGTDLGARARRRRNTQFDHAVLPTQGLVPIRPKSNAGQAGCIAAGM